jgi:hypothetical protein
MTMIAIARRGSIAGEIARAFHGMGRALARFASAEPAPYWADYLHQTRQTRD